MFDEEGPLGVKFRAQSGAVKIVNLKEHYQADLHEQLTLGLILVQIDNKPVTPSKAGVLSLIHAARRPLSMKFTPNNAWEEDEEEEDHKDDDLAFWDDEEYEEAVVVEDLEAGNSAAKNRKHRTKSKRGVAVKVGKHVPVALREHGAALVAVQRQQDRVERLKQSTLAADAGHRKARNAELQEARKDLADAQEAVPETAQAAAYSFESCTVHVENVADNMSHEEVEQLFSVFGQVVQISLQRRPGVNSNWALVTVCSEEALGLLLAAHLGMLSGADWKPVKGQTMPTEEQITQLQELKTSKVMSFLAPNYGHVWLEAHERANATVRAMAVANKSEVRNDFGAFADTNRDEDGETSAQAMVPRRRAPVCERRRQVAAQMRVCETAVDALFYACDRDSSGSLDREELGILMAELNGGSRVSEFSIQFVLDRVQSQGDGSITREELKPAITLWRYLQHEQDFVAEHFDDFDKKNDGKVIGKNEVGQLLKKLNSDSKHPDGIPPAVAEVEWVMAKAQASHGAGVDRGALRAAVALWYPFVYNRRRVEDLPSSAQAKAGRRRRAVAGMLGVHKHSVSVLLDKKYPRKPDPEYAGRDFCYKLTEKDLGVIMSELISTPLRHETVGQEIVEYIASTADLQGADNFEPEDIKNALAMWLCTRDVQPEIDEALQRYDEGKTGVEQRRQVHSILTELNDGIPTTWEEADWILESSDIDGNGTISRDEMRASVGWWFLHVARRRVLALKGWRMLVPWLCASLVCALCTYFVSALSVRFTEEKTQ